MWRSSEARFSPSVYSIERKCRPVVHEEQRLRFHQEHSGPVMEKLHSRLEAQFAERKTEPTPVYRLPASPDRDIATFAMA
jgi:hypothetical protein